MPTGLVLFKRRPYLRWRPKEGEQTVPSEAQAGYPSFADDFKWLERELMPHLRELDNEALRAQNQSRLEQVVLIFGGALAIVLGAVKTSKKEAYRQLLLTPSGLGSSRRCWRRGWQPLLCALGR